MAERKKWLYCGGMQNTDNLSVKLDKNDLRKKMEENIIDILSL